MTDKRCKALFAAAASVLFSPTAIAQPVAAVETCIDNFAASAEFLVQPAQVNARFFAKGDILVVHLNTYGEPAGGASRLLVRHPGQDGLVCSLVSVKGAVSFGNIFMAELKSNYDPVNGLELQVPVTVFDGSSFAKFLLTVTVNQADGSMNAAISK
ncbi:hypothetical protein IWQ49_005737 [Labrenzia sp. EL_126]|nr:hypothetical protein [Labrenzia sp. EL_126]